MANSDWANQGNKVVSKQTWASPVATAHERRSAERRQVTHEENGYVWGPPQQLLSIVSTAASLRDLAKGARIAERHHLAERLEQLATQLDQALGINGDQIVVTGPGWSSITTQQDLDDVQAEHDS